MKRLDKDVALDEDDNQAWSEAIKNVKKIKHEDEKPTAPLIINNVSPKIDYSSVYTGNSLQNLEIGEVNNIDRRTAERFKRGLFPIQKRLDLHGLTEKEAFTAVDDFIRKAYIQKLRCVLIVTGKGINNDNTPWYEKKGILKNSVPNWLNGSELRPLILSFCYAQPEDGGEGALYVLIRKNRKTT